MITGITGVAPRRGAKGGRIEYLIEADEQGFCVKMIRNVSGTAPVKEGTLDDVNCHPLGALIDSFVDEGGYLRNHFNGDENNAGFMSAVIEDILIEVLRDDGLLTFRDTLSQTVNAELVNRLSPVVRDRILRILNDLPRAQDGTASQG